MQIKDALRCSSSFSRLLHNRCQTTPWQFYILFILMKWFHIVFFQYQMGTKSEFHNLFRCSLFISLRRGNRHLKISIMLFDFRGRYCPVIYVTKMMTANIQLEFLHYMPCIGRNRLFSCDWLSNEHTVTQDRHKMLE